MNARPLSGRSALLFGASLVALSTPGLASAQEAGTGSSSPEAATSVPGAAPDSPVEPEQTTASPAPRVAEQTEDAVGEIVVTAQKRSEAINDVPMSITAVSGETLQIRGINTAADLVRITPGLQVTRTYSNAPVYTIRGVGFYNISVGSRPTVGVYADQAELPFAIMARGATLDLERVEVLKGPQGTLFGQNATGGLINHVAAKPTETFRYGGSATYGRFSEGDVQGFVSGPLSDTLSARLAVKHEFGSGWQKSYTRDDTLGAVDVTSARLLLDWHPSEAVKFVLNLNGFNDKSESLAAQLVGTFFSNPAGAPPIVENYPLAPRNNRAADWDPTENFKSDNEFRQVILTGDIDLGSLGTLTSLTNYAHMKTDMRTDSDGVDVQSTSTSARATLATASQEVRLAGDLSDRLDYVVGVSYAWYKAVELQRFDVGLNSVNFIFVPLGVPGTFTGNTTDYNARYKTASVFASVDYKFSDQLIGHAGIRYSKTKARNDACSRSFDEVGAAGFSTLTNFLRSLQGLPPLPIASAGDCFNVNENLTPERARFKFKEDGVPFRIGLDWHFTPESMVYANVSRGFKGGSYPVVGASQSSQYDSAKQEQLTAYEVGFKSSLLQRRLQLNGAVFYYDYKDKQVTGAIVDPVFGPLLTQVNVPKSKVKGAELQLDWRVTDGLTLSGGVTYLKPKIGACSSVDAASGEAGCQENGYYNFNTFGQLVRLTGQTFPSTPKWSGNLDAEYRLYLNDGLAGFVGGTTTFQSTTYGQLGRNFALGEQDPMNLIKLPAYTLLDLRAGVEGGDGKWRAWVWGRNVTDKYYRVGGAHPADTVVVWSGRPATYGLTVSFRN